MPPSGTGAMSSDHNENTPVEAKTLTVGLLIWCGIGALLLLGAAAFIFR